MNELVSTRLVPGTQQAGLLTGEAEKPSPTTATAEEAKGEALGNIPDDGGSSIPGTSLVETSSTLIRATMPLRVELFRLAQDPEAHRTRSCAGKAGCLACALNSRLFEVQRACAAAANLAARTLDRVDGQAYDDAKSRGEKVKDWPSKKLNLYELLWKAYPTVSRGTISALAKAVGDKWRTERFDVLVYSERAAARYKQDRMPIPLRAADVKFVETAVRDVFELHCSLTAGRTGARGKEWVIPIRSKDARQYRDLHAIATGAARLGEIKILRDRQGKHWELRIAYKRVVQKKTGDVLAAINRGLACILAVTTEGGDTSVYDGADIEAYLHQMYARRKSYQNAWRVSGRKGRGRLKALWPTLKLEDKAGRWRRTRMQTIAREVARWLQDRGVTRVLFDDLKGIRDGSIDKLDGGKPVWDRIQSWPYFEMGQRLRSCLEELGIETTDKACSWASRECPKCGHRHDEREVTRFFKCQSCGYRRHIDVVLGENLIKRERAG